MTPTDKHRNALRVAIAEHMQNIPIGFSIKSLGGWISHIPNYPGSLDAMNEAEKMLTEDQYNNYYDILADNLYRGNIRATALQRAEAFVAACGLTERVKEIEESL